MKATDIFGKGSFRVFARGRLKAGVEGTERDERD